MKTLVRRLFHLMASALRERLDLALETMALRHQLAVLERSAKRPSFSPVDRCFWVLLSAVWSRWPTALEIVHADTVRRWRRTGWRILWLRQHRRVGRPPLARKTQELIRWISQQNRLWGAPRLQGELAKLGGTLSRTTVAKYMVRSPRPPWQTWRTFLRNHLRALIVSSVYETLLVGVRTVGTQVKGRLHRWLARVVVRGWPRSSWWDARMIPQASALASLYAVWPRGAGEKVGVSERSPPDSWVSPDGDPDIFTPHRRSITLDVCPTAHVPYRWRLTIAPRGSVQHPMNDGGHVVALQQAA